MSNASPQFPVPRRRAVTAAVLVALLAGPVACAMTASSKLTPQTAPLRRVWVVVSLGSFDSLDPASNVARRLDGETSVAMRTNFPETLRRNGLPVSGFVQLARPVPTLDALKNLWSEHKASAPTTSHVLVLTAQRLRNEGSGRVDYEAVLWDTASETLVWKAAPSVQIGTGKRRTLEGQTLAGDLLRALQRDQLLALPKEYPVDADGAEIPREWIPMRLH